MDYEICLHITAKMLCNVLTDDTAWQGVWRRQGEAVKVSDLDVTISVTAAITAVSYTHRCV